MVLWLRVRAKRRKNTVQQAYWSCILKFHNDFHIIKPIAIKRKFIIWHCVQCLWKRILPARVSLYREMYYVNGVGVGLGLFWFGLVFLCVVAVVCLFDLVLFLFKIICLIWVLLERNMGGRLKKKEKKYVFFPHITKHTTWSNLNTFS